MAEGAAGAKFTSGSTMRHVVVMTATASLGLMSLFFVDAINLFYISLLGVTELAAAIGFAGTLQFFIVSVSIGMLIAGSAVVSRLVGAGDMTSARRAAGSTLVTAVLLLGALAVTVWVWRVDALRLLGAEGEALAKGADFLAISLPSVPLIGIGMSASATLRAIGAARDAMFVTLSGGFVAAVLDPILILALDLRLTGAAIAIVLTRVAIAAIGLWLVHYRHGMLAWPGMPGWLSDLPKLMAIAGPSIATQLSTPFGNAYLTRAMAEYGEAAVAGWAVTGRLTMVAFGGLFALSGAVGPILGQNLGARLFPRIVSTYSNALIFGTIYVLVVWALLWVSADLVATGFGVEGAGLSVIWAFATFGAGAFVFTGVLFVSNAAFNNLGRPLWSTASNWSRDAVAIPLAVGVIGSSLGPAGVIVAQALAGFLVGSMAGMMAWRFVHNLAAGRTSANRSNATSVPTPAFGSGRAASVSAIGSVATSDPLAQTDENR